MIGYDRLEHTIIRKVLGAKLDRLGQVRTLYNREKEKRYLIAVRVALGL